MNSRKKQMRKKKQSQPIKMCPHLQKNKLGFFYIKYQKKTALLDFW